MKKFGITFLATLVLGIFTVQAAINQEIKSENNTVKTVNLDTSTEFETVKIAAKVPTGLKNAVIDELIYPEFAQNKNLEGQVYMRITIDQDSNVKIVGLSSTTPYLGNYVREQLANTYVKRPGCKPGQVYLMKVNFDLLN